MFQLIFFMVILSITLQGWLLMPVAKLLKVAQPAASKEEPPPLELEVTHTSAHQEMKEFRLTDDNQLVGKTLAQAGLPKGALVTMLRRNGTFIPPGGDTVLKAGDGMLIMAEITLLNSIEEKFFSGIN